MAAPPQNTVAPSPAPAPAPAGPVNDEDLNHWKAQFNDVLARPSEHINSKSPAGATSWATSLFDCFNPIDTCLITCYIPCLTFGKTHHRVHKDGNLQGYEPVNTSCLLFCASGCCGLHWIPAAMQRAQIRQKYNLQGSCLEDLAISCCCACCNLIQQDKEAGHQEQLLLNNGATQQYKSNTEMVYPAPNPPPPQQ